MEIDAMFILERRKANGYSGNQPEFAGVPVSDAGTAGSGLSVLSGEWMSEQQINDFAEQMLVV
jgi:hypothetical protein